MINKDRFFYLIENNKESELEIFLQVYNKMLQIDSQFSRFITEKNDNDLDGLFLAAHKNFPGIVRLLVQEDIEIDSINFKGAHSPLSIAALNGYPEVVELLVSAGANINQVVSDESPLFSAAYHNRGDVVDLLLRLGADPNLGQISTGGTPLIAATAKGHLEIAKKLLPRSNPLLTMLNGFNVLHAAAEKGDPELIAQLKSLGVSLNNKTSQGSTPLHLAALGNNLSTFTVLIELGADLTITMPDGKTLMHIAAAKNNVVMLRILKDKGVDVNAESNDGDTPLCQAAKVGNCEAAKFLLENSANPNLGRNGTPIAIAVEKGHRKIFDLLIAWRVSLNVPLIFNGKVGNLNHVAVCHNRPEMLGVLIEQGVDKNACFGSESVAWMAAWRGQVECLAVLQKHGADLKYVRKNDGISLLDAAAYNGHVSSIHFLTKIPLDVNGTSSGFTPLYMAAQNGHIAALHLLIVSGAHVDLVASKTSETALHAAAKMGHIQALQLLITASAKLNPRRGDGATPLFLAALENQFEAVKFLLERGANSDIPLNDGSKLILTLKQRGMTRLIALFDNIRSFSERLKNYKGPINEEFLDPITNEVMNDPVTLSNGMIVDFSTFISFERTQDGKIKNPHDRKTFLLSAAYPCIALRTKIADFVLSIEKSMQNTAINDKVPGNSNTFFAERNSLSVEMRKLIFNIIQLLGFDPSQKIITLIKSKEYPSAMQEACKLGRIEPLNLLCSYLLNISKDLLLACINKVGSDGMTLLHLVAIESAKTNDPNILKVLVENGGNLSLKDDKGNVPLDYLGPDLKKIFLEANNLRLATESAMSTKS